jgi:MYXO-CTERM domain-containing protein
VAARAMIPVGVEDPHPPMGGSSGSGGGGKGGSGDTGGTGGTGGAGGSTPKSSGGLFGCAMGGGDSGLLAVLVAGMAALVARRRRRA